MALERWQVAEARAMQVASAFEAERGARLTDVSPGGKGAIRLVLAENEIAADGALSADLIARGAGDDRIIEVKHRALAGPFQVRERQIDTLRLAGGLAWLYLILNTTQPFPVELWVVQDPIRLPWVLVTPALRERGQARGVRHEAAFRLDSDDVRALGARVAIDGLDLPPWVGMSRD
jgi:hypothetical protein